MNYPAHTASDNQKQQTGKLDLAEIDVFEQYWFHSTDVAYTKPAKGEDWGF